MKDKQSIIDQYIRLNLNFHKISLRGIKQLSLLEKQWTEQGFDHLDLMYYRKFRRIGRRHTDKSLFKRFEW